MPIAPTSSGDTTSATQYDRPNFVRPIHARNAPIMYWAPWVKLMMLSSPKMIASPRLSTA